MHMVMLQREVELKVQERLTREQKEEMHGDVEGFSMLMKLTLSEWVLSKFNGTSTPIGSYRAKTGDNYCNVNSNRYILSTALCESIRYQAKSEQKWPDTQGAPRGGCSLHPEVDTEVTIEEEYGELELHPRYTFSWDIGSPPYVAQQPIV